MTEDSLLKSYPKRKFYVFGPWTLCLVLTCSGVTPGIKRSILDGMLDMWLLKPDRPWEVLPREQQSWSKVDISRMMPQPRKSLTVLMLHHSHDFFITTVTMVTVTTKTNYIFLLQNICEAGMLHVCVHEYACMCIHASTKASLSKLFTTNGCAELCCGSSLCLWCHEFAPVS